MDFQISRVLSPCKPPNPSGQPEPSRFLQQRLHRSKNNALILFISVAGCPLENKIGNLMEEAGIEITETMENEDNDDSNGLEDAINGNKNLSSHIKILKYLIYGNCL